MAVFFYGAALFCTSWMLGGCLPAPEPEPEPQKKVDLPSFRTTEPAVAIGNLDASIGGYEQRLAGGADTLPIYAGLLQALLTRASFTGSYGDFDRAAELTLAALERHPDSPDAPSMRARFLSAIHRFGEARSLLDEAEDKGLRTSLADAQRATIDLALGNRLHSVLRYRQRQADTLNQSSAIADLAIAHAALGSFDKADALFSRAAERYRDVSPFFVAWLMFQRGLMWAEMADEPDRARPYYEEAVRRLPAYVQATVHLAELEAEAGERARAVARLEAIADNTTDPEPAAVLGELLAEGRRDESAKRIEQARQGYEALLKRYPEAFADHAAEFFMGPGGEPERALQLALGALKERRNARSYLTALEAAEAAKARATLCTLWTEASRQRHYNRLLDAVVERARRNCR